MQEEDENEHDDDDCTNNSKECEHVKFYIRSPTPTNLCHRIQMSIPVKALHNFDS